MAMGFNANQVVADIKTMCTNPIKLQLPLTEIYFENLGRAKQLNVRYVPGQHVELQWLSDEVSQFVSGGSAVSFDYLKTFIVGASVEILGVGNNAWFEVSSRLPETIWRDDRKGGQEFAGRNPIIKKQKRCMTQMVLKLYYQEYL